MKSKFFYGHEVCKRHKWIEVTLSNTCEPDISYKQCGYCGLIKKTKKPINLHIEDNLEVVESKGQWIHKDDLPKPIETSQEYYDQQIQKLNSVVAILIPLMLNLI